MYEMRKHINKNHKFFERPLHNFTYAYLQHLLSGSVMDFMYVIILEVYTAQNNASRLLYVMHALIYCRN